MARHSRFIKSIGAGIKDRYDKQAVPDDVAYDSEAVLTDNGIIRPFTINETNADLRKWWYDLTYKPNPSLFTNTNGSIIGNNVYDGEDIFSVSSGRTVFSIPSIYKVEYNGDKHLLVFYDTVAVKEYLYGQYSESRWGYTGWDFRGNKNTFDGNYTTTAAILYKVNDYTDTEPQDAAILLWVNNLLTNAFPDEALTERVAILSSLHTTSYRNDRDYRIDRVKEMDKWAEKYSKYFNITALDFHTLEEGSQIYVTLFGYPSVNHIPLPYRLLLTDRMFEYSEKVFKPGPNRYYIGQVPQEVGYSTSTEVGANVFGFFDCVVYLPLTATLKLDDRNNLSSRRRGVGSKYATQVNDTGQYFIHQGLNGIYTSVPFDTFFNDDDFFDTQTTYRTFFDVVYYTETTDADNNFRISGERRHYDITDTSLIRKASFEDNYSYSFPYRFQIVAGQSDDTITPDVNYTTADADLTGNLLNRVNDPSNDTGFEDIEIAEDNNADTYFEARVVTLLYHPINNYFYTEIRPFVNTPYNSTPPDYAFYFQLRASYTAETTSLLNINTNSSLFHVLFNENEIPPVAPFYSQFFYVRNGSLQSYEPSSTRTYTYAKGIEVPNYKLFQTGSGGVYFIDIGEPSNTRLLFITLHPEGEGFIVQEKALGFDLHKYDFTDGQISVRGYQCFISCIRKDTGKPTLLIYNASEDGVDKITLEELPDNIDTTGDGVSLFNKDKQRTLFHFNDNNIDSYWSSGATRHATDARKITTRYKCSW